MAKPNDAQAPLIQFTNEEIIHNATLKQAEVTIAKSEAGRARKRCQDLEKQFDEMIQELIARDAELHGIQLELSADEDEPE
jgi:septin family protein